jgi:YggT family protein
MASLLFVVRAVLTWFRIGPDAVLYPLKRAIHVITEPALGVIRRIMPRTGVFDLSPLIAILLINVLLVPLAAAL